MKKYRLVYGEGGGGDEMFTPEIGPYRELTMEFESTDDEYARAQVQALREEVNTSYRSGWGQRLHFVFKFISLVRIDQEEKAAAVSFD